MIAWIRQWHAWWLMRKAISKYESAKFYRDLAAQEATEGVELERAATLIRLETTS